MQFTNYEKNVLLVSLDHMHSHLEAIEYEGVAKGRDLEAIKTARTKITQ